MIPAYRDIHVPTETKGIVWYKLLMRKLECFLLYFEKIPVQENYQETLKMKSYIEITHKKIKIIIIKEETQKRSW